RSVTAAHATRVTVGEHEGSSRAGDLVVEADAVDGRPGHGEARILSNPLRLQEWSSATIWQDGLAGGSSDEGPLPNARRNEWRRDAWAVPDTGAAWSPSDRRVLE